VLVLIAMIIWQNVIDRTEETSLNLPEDFLERGKAIHRYYPMVDGHNDLPYQIRNRHISIEKYNLSREHPQQLRTDIPRLRQGVVGGQFFSAFAPCDAIDKDAVRIALEQMDIVDHLADKYPEDLQMAYTPDDVRSIHEAGKIATMIGVEGGHNIDNSLAVLRQFYKAGARYMSLAYKCNTPWIQSSASTSFPNSDDGLTDFGASVVIEMNRIGMMVDLSHAAHIAMHAVLNVTQAPVIFSHSSAYTLCPHPRNVQDDVLARLAQNNGVIMINFYSVFISCAGLYNATVSDVADHIDHVKNTAGIEYVGYGSAFDDNNGDLPLGLSDVSYFPHLTAELYRRGYSNSDIEKVIGGNVLRVWQEVIDSAANLSNLPIDETQLPESMLPNSTCRTDF